MRAPYGRASGDLTAAAGTVDTGGDRPAARVLGRGFDGAGIHPVLSAACMPATQCQVTVLPVAVLPVAVLPVAGRGGAS
jgi:hypothetical protein